MLWIMDNEGHGKSCDLSHVSHVTLSWLCTFSLVPQSVLNSSGGHPDLSEFTSLMP